MEPGMVTDWDGDDVDDRWTLRASDRALSWE